MKNKGFFLFDFIDFLVINLDIFYENCIEIFIKFVIIKVDFEVKVWVYFV